MNKATSHESNLRLLKDTSKSKKSYQPNENSSFIGNDSNEENELLKVYLDNEAEVVLAKLLQPYFSNRINTQNIVSKRLTQKRLTDVYNTLEMYGFKSLEIEKAMKIIFPLGGDLLDTLDWLCLNQENLPPEFCFSNKIKHKNKEKFDQDICDKSSVKPIKITKSDDVKEPDLKQWVMQYAEDLDSSISDEEDNKHSPILDINEKYVKIQSELVEAKRLAKIAKMEKNKPATKDLNSKIREYMQELKSLETESNFDKNLIKNLQENVSEVPSLPINIEASDETNLVGLELFETQTEIEIKPKLKFDRRSFAYTKQQWTGKSPKQFLIDWLRKNLKSCPGPKFNPKEVSPGLWKSFCKISCKEKNINVCPDIVCDNIKEAEHLSSTLALYNLCGSQRVHQLLPPPYRNIWLEWEKSKNDEKLTAEKQLTKPRDKFISYLLNDISKMKSDDNCKSQALTNIYDVQRDPISKSYKDSNLHNCRKILQSAINSDAYKETLKIRSQLPVFSFRDQILSSINESDVIIICGETGSGKSTQVPHFILQNLLMDNQCANCNIICTQPRRISTIALANRTAFELNTNKPGIIDSLCAYQIRFETKTSPTAKLLYCTTGILLKKLQNNPKLDGITHVIIDEIHERSVESDFLLTLLKELCKERKQLNNTFKVILMSATVDMDKFVKYFHNEPINNITPSNIHMKPLVVSSVNIPGRTFPVQLYYIEDIIEYTCYRPEESEYFDSSKFVSSSVCVTGRDGKSYSEQFLYRNEDTADYNIHNLNENHYSKQTIKTVDILNNKRINCDLILETIKLIENNKKFNSIEGAILIFLPGLAQIQELMDLLTYDSTLSKRKHKILPLHSTLSAENQEEIFKTVPNDVRKIVLSTNIAETGITIPDVVFVIDCGKVKENWYDENTQISRLKEVLVSKASADQRKGRAGRVRDGFCFRLFTSKTYESMKPFTAPEILRVPLESLCLHILKSNKNKNVEEILSSTVDPPKPEAIRKALDILQEVGAINQDEMILTALGQHLSTLPVQVKLGRMLIFAAMFGVSEEIAIIAASMNEKSPFYVPLQKKDVAQQAIMSLAVGNSDQLTILNAFLKWKDARKAGRNSEKMFCDQYFIKKTTMIEIENISNELINLINSIGFSKNVAQDRIMPITVTERDQKMIKLIMTAGVYPNVARIYMENRISLLKGDKIPLTSCTTKQGKSIIHPSSVNKNINEDTYLIFHEKTKGDKGGPMLRGTTLIDNLCLLLFGGDIQVFHSSQIITIDNWIKLKGFARTGVIMKEIRKVLNYLLAKKLVEPTLNLCDNEIIKILIDACVSNKN